MKRGVDITTLPMSASVRSLNAHLFAQRSCGESAVSPVAKAGGKARLRQSAKPLLNSNELAFRERLAVTLPGAFVTEQAITLRLGNGVRYTPDFASYEPMNSGRLCFWEVKGTRKIFDGAGEKLKTAAALYKFAVFYLVWRDAAGVWQQQRILS